MRTVHIDTSHPYDVLIGSDLLSRAGELIRDAIGPCRAALVTDSTVSALYGDLV